MMGTRGHDEDYVSADVSADVDRPDTILFGLTARQACILAATVLVLWAAWTVVGHRAPVGFLAAAVPIAGSAFVVAVGRRDGRPLDIWLIEALVHHRRPHRLVPADAPIAAPPAWVTTRGPRLPVPAPLRLPARGITAGGLIDLGGDGTVGLVACSTVNFGLRSPAEQTGLITAFARWLNSLDTPVQILLRASRLDLTAMAERIEAAAPGLSHPALEAAARAHVAFLHRMARERELLHRQVTIAIRDTRSSTHTAHRAAETARALGACEITAQALDADQTAATLAGCLSPDTRLGPSTTDAEVPQ